VLPIGIEAYGGYALRTWLSSASLSERPRRFARWSALASLAVGAGAQVASHLMRAGGVTTAPPLVTVLVACVPGDRPGDPGAARRRPGGRSGRCGMTRAEKPGGELVPRPEELELAGPVLDAELVDDPPATAPGPRHPVRHAAVVVVRPIVVVIHAVRESERTVRTSKAVLRNAVYVVTGIGVLLRRLWEAKTNSRYERMMAAAEQASDLERVAEWEKRGELARERRHRRHIAWLRAPFQLAKAVAALVATAVGTLLLLGIVLAVANDNVRDVLGPIVAAVEVVAWTVAAVAVAWGLLMVTGLFLLVLGLWHLGRKAQAAPTWLRVHQDGDAVTINEESIAHALAHLGISVLARAAKDGRRLFYTSIPARDGARGVHATVRGHSGRGRRPQEAAGRELRAGGGGDLAVGRRRRGRAGPVGCRSWRARHRGRPVAAAGGHRSRRLLQGCAGRGDLAR
jgi:hypothetical protein